MRSNQEIPSKQYYVRIVGDEAAGKSALLACAAKQNWTGYYQTHGTQRYRLSDNKIIEVSPLPDLPKQFLDIEAGHPQHPRLRLQPVLIIYACALDNEQSILNLNGWKKEMETLYPGENIPSFVVGCKLDSQNATPELKNKARKWAENNDYPYWETSAKTGDNVDLMFKHLAYRLATQQLLDKDHFIKHLTLKEAEFKKRETKERLQAIRDAYKDISEKLASKEPEFKSFAELANNLQIINDKTQKLETNTYATERKYVRASFVTFLHHRLTVLNQSENERELRGELGSLEKIRDELQIIQPKEDQKNKPKTAMLELERVLTQLKDRRQLIIQKDDLIANEEKKPVDAMQFLAKAPPLSEQAIHTIISKHLMQPIDMAIRNQFSDIMKGLSNYQRKQLKKRLVSFTTKEIQKGNENYRALLTDKDKLDSPIPLIAILCIGGSGEPSKKTDSYNKWLCKMNESAPLKKRGWGSTLWHEGIGGVAHKAKTQNKTKALSPDGKEREALEEKLFPLDTSSPKKNNPS